MKKLLKKESLDVLEVLAAFDGRTFKAVVENSTALRVLPMQGRDPLEKTALAEDVQQIAAIFEHSNSRGLGLYEGSLKRLGADYGFMIV
jgi:hypothetical protein